MIGRSAETESRGERLMQSRRKRKEFPQPGRAKSSAVPPKPTWQEVFAVLDAAELPDDFLEDRCAGLSPIPEQREDL